MEFVSLFIASLFSPELRVFTFVKQCGLDDDAKTMKVKLHKKFDKNIRKMYREANIRNFKKG